MTQGFWIQVALLAPWLLIFWDDLLNPKQRWRVLNGFATLIAVFAMVTGGRGCSSAINDRDCQPSPNGPICKG